jgi:hypothetical protein
VAAWTLTRRAVLRVGILVTASCALACNSVDPGPNFVVPNATFDPDYFYCHVEPQYIMGAAYQCGPGKASDNNSCHFSSAVSGMALVNHPPVNCGGGDHPVDLTQIGAGSAAAGNYQAVSLEMSNDYLNAPVYVRPLGNSHPRAIFMSSDPLPPMILGKWASQ